MIVGYITSFTNTKIKGFAVDYKSKQPVEVALFIDGKKVKSQVADKSTKSKGVYSFGGDNGFEFNTVDVGSVHINDDIQVMALGLPIPFAPSLVVNRIKAFELRNNDSELFFFMHIPKTAGSSFRTMLNSHFKSTEIWPTQEQIEKVGYPQIEQIKNSEDLLSPKVKLIVGHYPLKIIRFLPLRPRVITFLRNPETHIISSALHRMKRHPKLKKMSMNEILKYHLPDNLQCRFFNPNRLGPDKVVNADVFEKILWNLNACEFIGITERFNESVDYIESKLNWKLEDRIEKNVNPNIVNLTREDKEIIKEKTFWDRKLYDAAVEIFEKNTADLNSKK